MQTWRTPGVAIAIVHGDAVVYVEGYGVREQGKPECVDERTVFAIGSTVKAMTTVALSVIRGFRGP